MQKKKNKSKEKVCTQCITNVGLGFLFDICKTSSLSNKVDCEDLKKQYLKGKISADQIVDILKKASGKNKGLLADIGEIDSIRRSGKIE